MRIFKRGKSWYADYMINGKRIMKSFGQQKKMAELFLKDVELKEARGELKLVDESLTWNDFQLRYLEHARVSKSSTTFRSDLCRLKVFNQFLKERNVGKLKQLDSLLMEDFKILILQKNSPRTFNHHVDLIRTMLNKAVEWKFLRENPLVDFKRLKNNRVRQVRFLNKEEIEQVMALADPFMGKVLSLLLYTGLRKSELVYLEWNDIDFENKLLTVQSKPDQGFHPKSYKTRHIPLNSELEKLLLDLPQNGRYVFDNGHDQPLHNPDFYYKNLMRIYRKANVKDANLHTLRHTFASQLVMAGVDIRTVQELLGHSTVSMTEKYSHLSPLHKSRAVELLRFGQQVETKLKQNPSQSP